MHPNGAATVPSLLVRIMGAKHMVMNVAGECVQWWGRSVLRPRAGALVLDQLVVVVCGCCYPEPGGRGDNHGAGKGRWAGWDKSTGGIFPAEMELVES